VSDDGTKAAKAIAHAVALEGVLAHADFFITQLHNFSLTDWQLKQLYAITEGYQHNERCGLASYE
jgi:hypothetical protein